MKHLAFAASLVAMLALTTPAAHAQYYVGALIGGGSVGQEFSTSDRSDDAGTVAFTVLGGYELSLGERFFVAGETYIDVVDVNISYPYEFAGLVFEDDTVWSSNIQFGVQTLFGVKFGKAAAYGLVASHFEYWELEEDYGYTTQNGTPAATDTASDSTFAPGWQVGVGGRYMFTNNIGIRGEYRFSQVDIDVTSFGSSYETTFQTHEAGIGLTYSF